MSQGIPTLAVLALCLLAVPCHAASSSEIASALELCDRKGGTCIDDLESSLLSKTGGRAKHSGGILTIHTRSGVVSFIDRPNAGDQTLSNSYLGIIDGTGYHLVYVGLWEGNHFVLVSDASGEQFPMAAIPHPSPSAKMVVSVSASEAYNPNEITVWRVTPERLTREYHYSPEEYALYRFQAWNGEDTIRLEKFARSKKEYCPNRQFMTVAEVLKYSQSKWLLSADVSANVKCQ